ncbi:hypothetical protein O4H52_08015 [Sphingomonadaceae bacterium G21617-S1]|nr:hypothetical protein [Sphingomonadaceae bacterium G21617-S1]
MDEDEMGFEPWVRRELLAQRVLVQFLMRHYLTTGAYYRDPQSGLSAVIGAIEDDLAQHGSGPDAEIARKTLVKHLRALLTEALS